MGRTRGKHPRALALLTEGYAALYARNYAQASKYFTEIRDRIPHQKFFLHWFWRMHAESGLSNVLLEAGDVLKAKHEADRFLKSALSTSDPYLQALAWAMRAKIAMIQQEGAVTKEHLVKALDIVNRFDVPLAAWRVHGVASEYYQQAKEPASAEQHRDNAVSIVLAMARSLDAHGSLRDKFLAAEPVRKVLDFKTQSANNAHFGFHS